MKLKNWMTKGVIIIRGRLQKVMKCICSGEQLKVDERVRFQRIP